MPGRDRRLDRVLQQRPAGEREQLLDALAHAAALAAAASTMRADGHAGLRADIVPGSGEIAGERRAMRISARNQLPGRVTGITRGEAIANVEIDVGGQRLVASITVEAVEQLGIAEGSEVSAVIKATDVMLGVEH